MSDQPGFHIQYFGTNCLFIEAENTRIIIDPHFSRLPKKVLLGKIGPNAEVIRDRLKELDAFNLDAVLLTHTHYDHALDAVETARQAYTRLYGSVDAAALAESDGLPAEQVRQVADGDVLRIGALEVEFIATTHLAFPLPVNAWLHLEENTASTQPHAHFWDYKTGEVFAMLIQCSGVRMFITGSAGFRLNRQQAPRADAAFLSIGGLGLQKMAYVRDWFDENVRELGVRKIYLTHWDDFSRPLFPKPTRQPGVSKTLRRIERLAQTIPGLSVELLQPGIKLKF